MTPPLPAWSVQTCVSGRFLLRFPFFRSQEASILDAMSPAVQPAVPLPPSTLAVEGAEAAVAGPGGGGGGAGARHANGGVSGSGGYKDKPSAAGAGGGGDGRDTAQARLFLKTSGSVETMSGGLGSGRSTVNGMEYGEMEVGGGAGSGGGGGQRRTLPSAPAMRPPKTAGAPGGGAGTGSVGGGGEVNMADKLRTLKLRSQTRSRSANPAVPGLS